MFLFLMFYTLQYFGRVTTEFSQNKLDELRDLRIKYVDEYKQVDEEESEDNDHFK